MNKTTLYRNLLYTLFVSDPEELESTMGLDFRDLLKQKLFITLNTILYLFINHLIKILDYLLDQLSRLHMILKPFMLRRVKKDVENELGDKVSWFGCDIC